MKADKMILRVLVLFILAYLVRLSTACSHGTVELVEGSSQYEGRIEVCVSGHWSSVCRDSFWGPPDARVICRQLGFLEIDLNPGHYSHIYAGTYSPGTGIIISKVECTTAEHQLLECNFKYGGATCTHSMDAGVQCMEGAPPTNLTYQMIDGGMSIFWMPSTSPYTNIEDLRSYLVTCIGLLQGDDKVKHTVEISMSNSSNWVTITGLHFGMYNYSCCVAADYQTYKPKICTDINFEVTTTASFTIEEETSTDIHTDVMKCTLSPEDCRDMTTSALIGSILGVVVMILVIILSVVSFFLITAKSQYKNFRIQAGSASNFPSNKNNEGQHAIYEVIDDLTDKKREVKEEDPPLIPNLCYSTLSESICTYPISTPGYQQVLDESSK